MPISKDLFLSILSMDAYNRGATAVINFGANSDANGTAIGNATIYDKNGGQRLSLQVFTASPTIRPPSPAFPLAKKPSRIAARISCFHGRGIR